MLQQIKPGLEFFFVKLLQCTLRLLSYSSISDAGAAAGSIFEKMGIRKRIATENLVKSNLNKSFIETREIVSQSYRYFGRTFFELLALDRIRLEEGRDYELILPERFIEQIARGAIFISAHIGNWELMGKVLVEKEILLAVVVKRQNNAYIDKLIQRQRENAGLEVVYEDEIVKLRRLIEKRYCIALLSDQDFGDNAIPVQFLGRSCFAPEGPVFFAKKFQIPIFLCFAIRMDDYVHRFEIKPFESDMSLANEILVQSYTNEIEKTVSSHPAQWLWHHRRWKVHA